MTRAAILFQKPGEAAQANMYNGLDERVTVTSGGTVRRFVYDPDGRVIGEYGTSATNVKAEFIWLHQEAAMENTNEKEAQEKIEAVLRVSPAGLPRVQAVAA